MSSENVVVVVVRAEREVSKAALAWALTHIVRPGDVVTLLAVLSEPHAHGRGGWRRMLWGFPRFAAADCRRQEQRTQISASCSQMALQIDGRNQINVRIKVLGPEEERRHGGGGVVAAESKRVGANWIVFDKHLKQEEKSCMEEVQCNIVVMKGNNARVLRLNLGSSSSSTCASASEPPWRIKHTTPANTTGGSSAFIAERNPLFENFQVKEMNLKEREVLDDDVSDGSSPESEFGFTGAPASSPSPQSRQVYWIPQNHISDDLTVTSRPPLAAVRTLGEQFSDYDRKSLFRKLKLLHRPEGDQTYFSDIREAVSLARTSPSVPPPLCSLCRDKAPVFGKPPRQFTLEELEEATGGFAGEQLVAEGWSGTVHRGELEDGRTVAVKRLRNAGDEEGVEEFMAEVEVLSRAQHRNVVMLVGFCVEGRCRVLVYEFVCNGSLDLHVHGRGKPPLDWNSRVRIAVGVARGLRYLHEDCRVGFVVHRDIRPNNVLLTHDFNPLVGDLSVRRWQPETSSMDAHLPQTFGYLAPEYIEHGIETEKSDVYAFGVLLLELITGRKAVDSARPKGQQFLVEWALPMLLLVAEEGQTLAVDHFLDPRVDRNQPCFLPLQLRALLCAASLCLRREPECRPTMSKVLRVLEGNALTDPRFDGNAIGSRSGIMRRPFLRKESRMEGSVSHRFARDAVSSALQATDKICSPFN